MSDTTILHTGENSPQYIAFRLLQEVAYAEKKELWKGASAAEKPDRKWILDTYSECLTAVQHPHMRSPKQTAR